MSNDSKQSMSLKVKVNESYPQDVNKSIARLDFEAMDKLGLQQGDIVLIKGKQETVAQVWRARFNDSVAKGTIKIDGTIRHNAGTSLDESVEVSKAECKEAKQVVLSPMEAVRFEPNAGNMIKQSRLLDKPLMQGDRVSFDIMGNVFNFVVTSLKPRGVCVVSIGSQVSISSVPAKLSGATKLPAVSYEDIGGLDEPIAKIREMVELPLKHPEVFDRLGIGAPKGVLLYGPPGCGKTLLAKAVASECEANFISIAGPEIVSKWYGESEAGLRRLFEQAEKNAPTIIFIDEIDAIAPKREEVSGEVERRIVSQLLTLMDGLSARGEVIVIAATNRPASIDEALRRPGRFDREIEINVPDKKSRKEILQIHTRGMPLTQNVDFGKLSEMTHGYTGADVNSLCKEAAMKALRKRIPEIKKAGEDRVPTEVLEKIQVSMPDFKKAFREISPSAMREVLVQNPNVKWSDIGGLKESKQEIKEVVDWPLKYAESFKRLNIVPPKGILLYGPPGCGKTLLAKAVATESGANFITVKGPELINKYVGESERGIRKIFRRARQVSPCVLFFDEFDSIAQVRGSDVGSNVSERVVDQLLAEMDGIESLDGVVVIAATNRPDLLDPGLMRPGRFDKKILIDAPDKDARLSIFKVHTKGMPLANDVDLKSLASRTDKYSGADIAAVCREAALFALRESRSSKEVKDVHFEKALKKINAGLRSLGEGRMMVQ